MAFFQSFFRTPTKLHLCPFAALNDAAAAGVGFPLLMQPPSLTPPPAPPSAHPSIRPPPVQNFAIDLWLFIDVCAEKCIFAAAAVAPEIFVLLFIFV